MRVLNAECIRGHLGSDAALALAKQAVLLSAGDRQKTPLRSMMQLPTGAGLMGCMPGWIADPDRFGIKLVNIFPANTRQGLSSHLGAVLLFDGSQGKTLALLDASAITAIRTAAVSAVATETLSCEGAQTLGIFGTGEQAVEHIRLLSAVRAFRDVFVMGSSPEKAQAFVAQQQGQPWLKNSALHAVDSARALSDKSDVVCTLSSSTTPLLQAQWLRPGQHINAVGASQPAAMEITPEHILNSRYFVDSLESLAAEAGEFVQLRARAPDAMQEVEGILGQVVTGQVPGRQNTSEITIYRSLGIAVQDMVFASYLYDLAESENIGQFVEF
jgi:alanine dehydrogenase